MTGMWLALMVIATAAAFRDAELDLAQYSELAGLLAVRATPTTLAVARSGHELFRPQHRIRPVPELRDLPPAASAVEQLRGHQR